MGIYYCHPLPPHAQAKLFVYFKDRFLPSESLFPKCFAPLLLQSSPESPVKVQGSIVLGAVQAEAG